MAKKSSGWRKISMSQCATSLTYLENALLLATEISVVQAKASTLLFLSQFGGIRGDAADFAEREISSMRDDDERLQAEFKEQFDAFATAFLEECVDDDEEDLKKAALEAIAEKLAK